MFSGSVLIKHGPHSSFLCFLSPLFGIQGTTVVDNLLNSDDVHYMIGALRALGLNVEEDKSIKRAIVEGCAGQFPAGKESRDEVQLFLGNAGTAMRPLTAAVTAAGGNSWYAMQFHLAKAT